MLELLMFIAGYFSGWYITKGMQSEKEWIELGRTGSGKGTTYPGPH